MKMDVVQVDVRNCLLALPMFNEFSKPAYDELVKHSRLRHMDRGNMVFRSGDACEEFHFLIDGQVKLYVVSSAGHEKVIEMVGPGHSFEEATMFTDQPHPLNAQALNDIVLISIKKQVIFEEIARTPRFSIHMLSNISHRVQSLLRDIEGYSLNSGMQRLIDYLLTDFQEDHILIQGIASVYLPASKATIASRLSLTPEYFSRVLHELETEKLIEIDKRVIRILDSQRLARYGKEDHFSTTKKQ